MLTVILSCTLMPIGKGPIAVPRWRMSVGRVEIAPGKTGTISVRDVNGVDVEASASYQTVESVTIIDKETGAKGVGMYSAEVYKPADASGAQQGFRVSCELLL